MLSWPVPQPLEGSSYLGLGRTPGTGQPHTYGGQRGAEPSAGSWAGTWDLALVGEPVGRRHTGNVRALDLHSPRAVLFSCPGSSRAGDDEASRALPQEDAGPGAAGVGVCCASADILALQLGLAAVALRAEETPTHEAQSRGSAFVAARLGAPPRQRHNNTSLLWRGVATAARKRTFQC